MQDLKNTNKTITLLFCTLLINMLGFGMVIPVKPQLIMDITGGDLADTAGWSGYLLLGYALAQFFAGPIIAALSDKFGRRMILLIALIAVSIDYLIMGIAQHIELLFITRILSGIFGAILATVNACVADVTPVQKRAINFSIVSSALGLGLMIGPSLGGFIGEYWGTRAPLFFASGLAVINFLFVLFFLEETLLTFSRKKIKLAKLTPFGVLKRLKNSSLDISLMYAAFLLQLAFHSFAATWTFFTIAKFEWGFSEIGWSLLAVGGVNLLFQGGFNRILIPKLGERKSLVLGIWVSIFAFIAYALADEAWMIYLIIIISGFGGLMMPSLQSIMSGMLPAQKQGELMGAITATNAISLIVGPLLMTQTFSFFTKSSDVTYFPGAPFLLASILVITAMIVVKVQFYKNSKTTSKNMAVNIFKA